MRLKATQRESAGALDGRRGAAAAMARTLALWAAGALIALPALAARAGFPQFPDGYDKFENTLQFDGNLLKRYVFRTRASSEQVRTFYREALAEQGWKEACPDEAELLGTLLKIPDGDVLSFKNEDVRVSIVIMSAPGMNDRAALVNVMFPWAMQGGMGRLGDGNALYPSGKATLRLNQPVGEGRVLFEQAECAEAPALVVPYAVSRLLEQGWQETGEMAAMAREMRALDTIRFLSRDDSKFVILSAPKEDKTGWLYSFVQYENLDIGAWRNFALAAGAGREAMIDNFMQDPSCGCGVPAPRGPLSTK